MDQGGACSYLLIGSTVHYFNFFYGMGSGPLTLCDLINLVMYCKMSLYCSKCRRVMGHWIDYCKRALSKLMIGNGAARMRP